MSQQGHLQRTHAVGTVAIPVFFVCLLCAPTHEPTYLSPLTCVCSCTACVCVRAILTRPLRSNPLLSCVVCVSLCVCLQRTVHISPAFTSVYPIIQQCVVSVSQRLTCPHWQEPYCLVHESYARTPLVVGLQMALINYRSPAWMSFGSLSEIR